MVFHAGTSQGAVRLRGCAILCSMLLILALLTALVRPGGRLEAELPRVTIIDDTVEIPASKVIGFPLLLRQSAAVVECSYAVDEGGSGVRVLLLRAADAEELYSGHAHRPLISTPYQRSGGFRYRVPLAGDYVLVLDNRMEGRGVSKVRLHLSAVFGQAARETVRYLPRSRRIAVVVISLLVFASIVTYSGRKLAAAMAARRNGGPPALYG